MSINKLLIIAIIAIIASLAISVTAQADPAETFIVSADSIKKHESYWINANWKYIPGDDRSYAEIGFNDSSYIGIDSRLQPVYGNPESWNGIAWFRLLVDVDSALAGKVLGLRVWQAGASEIYLNGNLIQSIGEVSGQSDNEIPGREIGIRVIVFDKAGKNLLSVRYSNHNFHYFHSAKIDAGFSLALGDYNVLNASSITNTRDNSINMIVFITAALSLAILHLFLFFFDRRNPDNLYYVLFLTAFALYILMNLQRYFPVDMYTIALFYRLSIFGLLISLTLGTIAVYSIFKNVTKLFWLAGIVVVILSVLGFVIPGTAIFITSYVYIMIISSFAGHIIWRKRRNNLGGEWIIRSGFIFMSVAGIATMLQSFGIIANILGMGSLYLYGVLGFIISMSFLLARDFVVTGRNLEIQLKNVEELSRKNLISELEAKELETKKRLLEADNSRKTIELEEARNLQLSMLPQNIPQTDNLEIAAFMITATEVGGDYYDFSMAKDGSLNVAIGDATGHGTKAGIMVASVKSLFNALGSNMMIKDFFQRSTTILKEMNLGNLFMSMSLLRIKSYHAILSSAGMPPVFVYKEKENKVYEHILKGMPLGAFTGFEYDEIELDLAPGDIILMMSDGLMELFNEKMEMFGERRIMDILLENSKKSPVEIIDILNLAGNKWRGIKPQQDDITYVALKIK